MPRSTASAPIAAGDRGDAIGVGGDDLAGAGRAARRQQFVAGGDDGDQRPPNDRQRGVVGRGRQRQRRRVEHAMPVEQRLAFREIEPGLADVAACRDRLDHLDRAGVDAARILLDEDRVGAVGHRRAGEDAHGLAFADRAVERRAGRRFADHRKPSRRRRGRLRARHSRPSPKQGRAAACAAP